MCWPFWDKDRMMTITLFKMWTTESIKQDVSLLHFFTALFNKWLSPWINSPSIRETLRKRFSAEPCGYKFLMENKDYSVCFFQKRHNFDFCRGHIKYHHRAPTFMLHHYSSHQWHFIYAPANEHSGHTEPTGKLTTSHQCVLGHLVMGSQRPTQDLMKNGGEVCLWVVWVISTWVYLKSHMWHDDLDGMRLLTSCCEFMFIKSPEPCSLISRCIYLIHEDASSTIWGRPKSN